MFVTAHYCCPQNKFCNRSLQESAVLDLITGLAILIIAYTLLDYRKVSCGTYKILKYTAFVEIGVGLLALCYHCFNTRCS